MFGDPPPNSWTVVARDPTFAGTVQSVTESDVVSFTLVWIDAEGRELASETIDLPAEAAQPLPVLNAALREYTKALRRRYG